MKTLSVHLHVRSCYTLLNSTLTIDKIIKNTKKHGYDAVALCDKGVMHGAMSFYHACQKEGIKPIFGLEVDALYDDDVFNFVLLAKNDEGYVSLLKLSTYLNTEEHETIDIEHLSTYTKDCVVLTGGDSDAMETMLLQEKRDRLKEYLHACTQYFVSFYVSIARNDSGLLKKKNQSLKEICREVGIPFAALSRVYYEDMQDEECYRTLCAIDQGKSLDDKTLNSSSGRYFRSPDEMKALYDDEELIATEEIAMMCNVQMNLKKAVLPEFSNRYGISSEEFLRQLCHKGLAKRMNFQSIPKVYIERLNYELDVIISMHYADYFLIVWDFIRFAKTQDIYIGPGRGSAAGSLVAYCLGITHADPIKYHLLFERFLNPERVSMPDIDTDFPDNRRDEVIDYVTQLYGAHCVAHIITFNTLAAKQVLRDVGRAMDFSLREIDILCKLVPNRLKITLKGAYEESAKFKERINSSEKYKRLFRIALRLEGLPRHASLHAAGIILSNENIDNVCPLIDVDEGVRASQFTMEYLEELGLIKMDFLGLRNLTIIDEIVHHINETAVQKLEIMKIPLDDALTYQLIRDVDTIGVFQLESDGMKNLIRKMKPRNFEDIVATIALYRPGPMENIPEYLDRREHPEKIDYIHPDLKPILENTYGIMIYQEQIMQVATKMAGFSLGKADNLRKAISKKKGDELIKLQADFIKGAVSKGYTLQLAQHVYDLIMKFANYGFNRSHSVAYGMIAYQLAYLKANYPLYFFNSLLNSVIGADSKTNAYVFEAKKRNIKILLPNVNTSELTYHIEQDALRYPLIGIKGIGRTVAQPIIEERKKHGPYLDFFDFVARMMKYRINKKTMEALIHAGALDDFKINRVSMVASLDDAIRYGDLVKIEDEDQILLDFDLVSKPAMTYLKENTSVRAEKEKEYLGFYLTTHPIEELRNKIDPQLRPIVFFKERRGYVKFICQIEKCKPFRTKNGHMMMFVAVNDETGKFDLVCMPNIYEVHEKNLVKGNYLYVEGVIDKENSCLVKKLTKIER